jgi:hypothetical protein
VNTVVTLTRHRPDTGQAPARHRPALTFGLKPPCSVSWRVSLLWMDPTHRQSPSFAGKKGTPIAAGADP